MAKNIIRSVKGTRDFYPEIMGARVWLYEKMRAASEAFGYQEYEGPILESLELYAAKSGEEIVEKQSYVFDDRSGDRITLRPELTPTLARMVASKQQQLTFPLRWWSFGPFWRYERPQKGRLREFFQWNIDMIGDDSPEADAELIAIAATFLQSLGLKPDQVQILVNNRKLIDQETRSLEIGEDLLPDVYSWIDRKDKLEDAAWKTNGAEMGLSAAQIEGIAAMVADQDLWQKSEELQRLFAAIEAYGVSEYVSFAPHIIRGLLYYTGTVFEAWDTGGEFRALFGGGRYDNLVADVGGDDVPAVGYAVGDVVITLLLNQLGLLPNFERTPGEVYITLFDEKLYQDTLMLGQELRQAGFRVTNELNSQKLGKQFRYADRIGARVALILGPDEISNNTVAVKNLVSGDQITVERKELKHTLTEILEVKTPS